jgi:hypothetical protein
VGVGMWVCVGREREGWIVNKRTKLLCSKV